MEYEFPRISRARLKTVNVDSKIIGDGSTDDPTEEEKAWIDIMKSTAPELEPKKKKVGVCVQADIVEYDANDVKISYDGVVYSIKKPANSLQIARAYERGVMSAFEALASQFCVCMAGVPCADLTKMPVEAIRLLSVVAENFFFAPYL